MTEQNRSQPPRGPNNSNNQSRRPHHAKNQRRNHPNQNTKNRQPHPVNNIDQLLMQFDRLVEQHIEARKKFFEFYYRVDYNRRDKLEDQFYFTGQNILRFQRELPHWQLKELQKHRTDIYSIDNIYSSSHPEGENLPMNPAVNEAHYHLSPKQLKRESYRADQEISVGTYEDYLSYKATQG